MSPFEKYDLKVPLLQAPMAGVATPWLAAEVCNAGAIGSLGLGASSPDAARAMVEELRARTAKAFNLNFFVHQPATADPAREQSWIERLSPAFAQYGGSPPDGLREIYTSFNEDEAMQAMVLEVAPAIVSFHFGVPAEEIVRALRERGILLLASATSPTEAQALQRAGIDVIVAQGIEAGGHRSVFDPAVEDHALGTFALTRLLARSVDLPVIAAGAIMDGAGIAAARTLGAVAAQLGTAFIACPESAADEAYRASLLGPGSAQTRLTAVISGRPARALPGRFTQPPHTAVEPRDIPDYPIAYDAAKALHNAARAHGDHTYGAHWAGQGAPLARAMPAAELVRSLADEYTRACLPR